MNELYTYACNDFAISLLTWFDIKVYLKFQLMCLLNPFQISSNLFKSLFNIFSIEELVLSFKHSETNDQFSLEFDHNY